MAKIENIAAAMGAKIVSQVPETGDGSLGASRLAHIHKQRTADLTAEAKKMKPAQAPFDTEDNLLSYPEGDVRWYDNHEFEATVRIESFERGRSARFIAVNAATGKSYPIFMVDMLDVMKRKEIIRGTVSGTWFFRKRGSNYGLGLVE